MKATVRAVDRLDSEDDTIAEGTRALSLQLTIGPEDESAADLFDVTVATVDWVAEQVAAGPLFGRSLLIVRDLDLRQVEDHLRATVASLSADDWDSLSAKLSRLFSWEFAD